MFSAAHSPLLALPLVEPDAHPIESSGRAAGVLVGGQEKEWMGCFLNDLRAFGINADQWTTAAEDEGE